MKKNGFERIKRFFKAIYLKLFRINDTPQKIAIGFGLGVFFGVIPGTGVAASLVAAFLFKVNRASALLGSILTNTWLSIPVFFLSVKVGAAVTGSNYVDLYNDWKMFLRDFHWSGLLQISIYKIIFPIMIGYLIVSLFIGLLAYVITLTVVKNIRNKKSISKKI